ncbi:helix-turn-helix domain-containing protein [Bacteroides mediterraneensis]|uniref:Helix-turn-helix domain-containing protein n=1 Tax=Bacteroides mediterraneensis TaxID=1841856 RepID=A0ABS2ESN4_9BACE|nr:helix-turn-helix domain-containing protein [Bacteroides mediterraneensis]MBM6757403.1 helix-turn-helix domain-containing protein [Bacteroides mediterraneensis]
MRKQSQINRAIEHLKSYNDAASRIQVEVLEMKRSESWVFNQYVRDVPEDERNETLFYAARDAAQFLAGKIGISAICPDLEDEPEEEEEEGTITLSLSEYKKLLLRLERVERRLGLRVGDVAPAPRKDISEAPDELIGQADACRLIGCAKTTIKQWANKGLITRYQKGYNVYYSRRELLGSSVVKDYKDSKKKD